MGDDALVLDGDAGVQGGGARGGAATKHIEHDPHGPPGPSTTIRDDVTTDHDATTGSERISWEPLHVEKANPC